MTFRIIENKASFTLANEAGDFARDTNGEIWFARTAEDAAEALAYLNQPRAGIEPRAGSHRMKSIFGKF